MISIILVSKQSGLNRTLRTFLETDPELELESELSGADEALER
jgi:hypothetical protein